MCLAIFKPPGKDVSEAKLKGGWQSNPGGAGFAFVKGKKVVTQKGFMKLQDFLEAYNIARQKNKKSPFLIHFRIPSMGDSTAVNTHPFPFGGVNELLNNSFTSNAALIHNGTIYGTGAVHGAGPSDTAKFTERYGPKLTFVNVEENKKYIDLALGYNKVVILYNDGSHQILNEKEGHWMDGVWFSNRYFLTAAERIGGAT